MRGATEVFVTFLKLGLTSFGGPVAHLGYFRRELVERRRWVDDAQFAQLVSLCQFLPGPASSQLGFALGLQRAGWAGAFAACFAFTTPSVLLLLLFAQALPLLDSVYGEAALHGLKLLAVCVVAQAVLGMIRRLAPDLPRGSIAAASLLALRTFGAPGHQLAVIAVGALLGLLFLRTVQHADGALPATPVSRRLGSLLLVTFGTLLALSLLASNLFAAPLAALAAGFYRAGSLVFGGGHVVLPLLREAVVSPGWVSEADFIAGYGAAQLVPGPLFSIAAFLGARLPGTAGGALGALVGIVAILLPGFLLVAGVMPWWRRLAALPRAGSALAGANAAVTGLLAAALYDPVWTGAVWGLPDAGIVAAGFALLFLPRAPLLFAAAWCLAAALLGA